MTSALNEKVQTWMPDDNSQTYKQTPLAIHIHIIHTYLHSQTLETDIKTHTPQGGPANNVWRPDSQYFVPEHSVSPTSTCSHNYLSWSHPIPAAIVRISSKQPLSHSFPFTTNYCLLIMTTSLNWKMNNCKTLLFPLPHKNSSQCHSRWLQLKQTNTDLLLLVSV